jgi:hypothetical protein
MKSTLTPHGKTKEVAEHVVKAYKDREDYKDNKTVQIWVQDSIEALESIETESKELSSKD